MWRIEMQAEQERLLARRILIDYLHGAIAKQLGDITIFFNGHIIVPEVRKATGILVREIIHATGAKPIKMLVTTLEWTKIRHRAEMPLADQRGAVTLLLQQRWQCGMFRRQADITT